MIADFFSALFTDITAFFDKPLGFGGPLLTGHIVIWAIIIGFALAGIISLYTRSVIGTFVSYLLKNKAHTPETARALSDAGIKNPLTKASLSKNGTLSRLVKTQDVDLDAQNRRYYIEEKDAFRADRLYARGGANPVTLVFALVLLIIAAVIIYTALPELIQMAKNFTSMVKPESNIA
ncbi:MAG: hypothetical protein J6V93_02210 [Clostridia bacterium]|nr:hypothetical protein [Clostridia bacterium]